MGDGPVTALSDGRYPWMRCDGRYLLAGRASRIDLGHDGSPRGGRDDGIDLGQWVSYPSGVVVTYPSGVAVTYGSHVSPGGSHVWPGGSHVSPSQ